MKIGYTTGVFDLFHVGHVRLLQRAKDHCDYLIVGVTSDELVSYKNKQAVIPHSERMEIISSIKFVDKVVPQNNMNKMEAWHNHKFDVMFVGDDWKGTPKWNAIDKEMKSIGVTVTYFPYTKGTSSTLINTTLNNLRAPKN